MQFKKRFLLWVCSFLLATHAFADAAYLDNAGQRTELSNLGGKWLIVNYWAGWCGGCIKEIPELNRFYQDYKNKLIFLGVNYDRLPPNELKNAISKAGINFPVLLEEPAAWNLGEIEILPTTFIINPQGQIVKILVGPSTEEALKETLKSLGATIS